MISGIGEPGDWNGHHFKSPSVLDVGDFLLVAYEGWTAPMVSSGIGLMIGIERWIQVQDPVLVFSFGNGYSNELVLSNHGAGSVIINSIESNHPDFRMELPAFPYRMKPADRLIVPVRFTDAPVGSTVGGTIRIRSNSQVDDDTLVYLVAY